MLPKLSRDRTVAKFLNSAARDVNAGLIGAVELASWLRSSTTTHRLSKNARSLTVYDAHNA
jgi:hypothetical protein